MLLPFASLALRKRNRDEAATSFDRIHPGGHLKLRIPAHFLRPNETLLELPQHAPMKLGKFKENRMVIRARHAPQHSLGKDRKEVSQIKRLGIINKNVNKRRILLS